MPRRLALGITGAFVLLMVAITLVAFFSARGRDLALPNTVADFQKALYGGNYEKMWDLAAPEYRDGLDREQFIERARATAPTPTIVDDWSVSADYMGDAAYAWSLVKLRSGGTAMHEISLVRIDGEWQVTSHLPYEGPWPPQRGRILSPERIPTP